jgi:hypothetical protein
MTDLWFCGTCGFVEIENGRCSKCLSENVIPEYTATSGIIAGKVRVVIKDGLAKHWEEESKRLHIVTVNQEPDTKIPRVVCRRRAIDHPGLKRA